MMLCFRLDLRMSLPVPLIATAQTLPDLLAARLALTPEGEAYREADPGTGQWRTYRWSEVAQRVARWRGALLPMQLPHGARVAILLPNGLDALCMDQACLAHGAVPVPLHAIDNPGSIAFILGDAQVSMLAVQQRAQWDAIAATGASFPALRAVVVTGPWGAHDPLADQQATVATRAIPVMPLAMWLSASVPDTSAPGPAPDDLAAMVYTSGTTGKPKGVMLTHAQVVANVRAVLAVVQPTEQDRFLSFLPLSHTFERTAGYYLPIAAGSCVAYARSVQQLSEDMLSQRPTVLISVPRIYERVHAKLLEVMAKSPIKSRLMAWTQAMGWRRFRAAQHLPPEPGDHRFRLLDTLLWPLLQRAVAQAVLARFGGRLRVAVSGGAALPPHIAKAFLVR
jgi:long-chain acyl-CoA synthetase